MLRRDPTLPIQCPFPATLRDSPRLLVQPRVTSPIFLLLQANFSTILSIAATTLSLQPLSLSLRSADYLDNPSCDPLRTGHIQVDQNCSQPSELSTLPYPISIEQHQVAMAPAQVADDVDSKPPYQHESFQPAPLHDPKCESKMPEFLTTVCSRHGGRRGRGKPGADSHQRRYVMTPARFI